MVQVNGSESSECADQREFARLAQGLSRHKVVAAGDRGAEFRGGHRLIYRQIPVQASVARRGPSALAPQHDSASLRVHGDLAEGENLALARSQEDAVVGLRREDGGKAG